MPDFNPGLLQIGDLGGQIQAGRQAHQRDQQALMGSVSSLMGSYQTARDNEALNAALQANFDPATGALNQQGVLAQMYQYKPQLAAEMGQKYAAQALSTNKTQADINKTNAEVTKLGAESEKTGFESRGLELKQQLEKQQALGQAVLGIQPGNPASFKLAMDMARKIGAPVELFEGIDPSDPKQIQQMKQQSMGMLIDANKQVENEINQQNANSGTTNAQTGVMNAQTQQQKANQDYELGIGKLGVDQGGLEVNRLNAQNEAQARQATLAQAQAKSALEAQKAGNELQTNKIEEGNKLESKMSSLRFANKVSSTLIDNVDRLLKSPLLTSGMVVNKDPKTGKEVTDFPRDKDGKIIPVEGTLGGMFSGGEIGSITGNARLKFEPGSNKHKAAKAEYDTLIGAVRGKTVAELKSAVGSIGPITDKDAAMFNAMDSLPDTYEEWSNLTPDQRVNSLDMVKRLAREVIENNNAIIEATKAQKKVIGKQSVGAIPPLPNGRPGVPNAMPEQASSGITVVAPLPKIGKGGWQAPNGQVLTDEIKRQIERQFGQG